MFKKSLENNRSEDERRRAPRLPPSAIPAFSGARLASGPEVELLNISRGGALIESEERLTPRSTVNIQLVAGDLVYLLRGRVLRSQVIGFSGKKLKYQSGIQFAEEFRILPGKEADASEAASSQTASEAVPVRSEKQAVDRSGAARSEESAPGSSDPGVVLTAYYASPEDLQLLLDANDW